MNANTGEEQNVATVNEGVEATPPVKPDFERQLSEFRSTYDKKIFEAEKELKALMEENAKLREKIEAVEFEKTLNRISAETADDSVKEVRIKAAKEAAELAKMRAELERKAREVSEREKLLTARELSPQLGIPVEELVKLSPTEMFAKATEAKIAKLEAELAKLKNPPPAPNLGGGTGGSSMKRTTDDLLVGLVRSKIK